MKYQIISAGYDGGPIFDSLDSARAEMAKWKLEDYKNCKRKFRTAKIRSDSRSYIIEFGMNLYSSASIVEL